MKKLSVFVFTLPLLLAACGGGTTPDPVGPGSGGGGATDPEPDDTGGPFKEIKLFEGDKHVLTMRKDGVVILVDQNAHVGTLKPDGTLEITGGEGKNARLEADGSISLNGEKLPLSIDENASIVANGQIAHELAADGTVSGQSDHARPLRWEGVDTPELRRYAMFLLVLVSSAQAGAGAAAGDAMPKDELRTKRKSGGELKADEEGEEEKGE